MALKIPLRLKVLGARLGAVFAPLFPVQALAQQAVFYKSGFPVPRYKSIKEITDATAKLRWTEDPWNGKLDVIKHPTFMQQAIEKHPDYAGDCDDFAAYWCVALDKSALADEQWFACGLWVDPKTQEIAGHAVCVFRVKDKWWYAGNWNQCVPLEINCSTGWFWDFEKVMNVKVFTARMWRAYGTKDDSLMLDRSIAVAI